MAVAVVETDTWIQHLLYVGGPRPSPYGPTDGMFTGVMAGTGDNTGGNFTLSGRLSFDRKEDWVYILGGTHTRVNSAAVGGDVFEQINTGPLTPTGVAAITNATFEYGGLVLNIGGNALSFTPSEKIEKVQGLPVFGDKRIAGIFLMYAAGWETNAENALYSAQIWGWLVRYSTFFRGVSPDRG